MEQHVESQAGMMDDVDINMPIADVAAMLVLLELRSSKFVPDIFSQAMPLRTRRCARHLLASTALIASVTTV